MIFPYPGVQKDGKYGVGGGSWKDYKAYVCQDVDGEYYEGFKPDKVAKSGLFELKSPFLADAGFPAIPDYVPIPEHENLKDDEFILTTYKVSVQTHSRTQGCKYLSEIFHDNPAILHPSTAGRLGIADGDRVALRSSVGEIETTVRLTEGIVPGVVAISNHCGHWQWGRFATAGQVKNPMADSEADRLDPDIHRIWWTDKGVHPNWIIPNKGDPIGGMQRWMDTVVSIRKA